MTKELNTVDITPGPSFYTKLSSSQVQHIIESLDQRREIPLEYTYLFKGADSWDAHVQGMVKEKSPNSLINTVELLSLNIDYISSLTRSFNKVNIVDLGPGNGMPIRDTLHYFHKKGVLNHFIAIDASQDILKVTERNIAKWFNNEITFKGVTRNLNHDQFDDLLQSNKEAINLIFLLGGTIANLPNPPHTLRLIHESMHADDALIITRKLDNEPSRQYYKIAIRDNEDFKILLGLLNIRETHYSLEKSFNEHKRARQLVARLHNPVRIHFTYKGTDKIIGLNKDETILLWRARHQTDLEILEELRTAKFKLMQASQSFNNDYLLTISKIAP